MRVNTQYSIRSLLIALLLPAAWAASLFFSGYRDITYAPVNGLLLLVLLAAILPACWRGLKIPAAPAALWLGAFWLYVTLSLTWSNVPFVSLVTWIVFLSLPLTVAAFTLPADGEDLLRPATAALAAGFAILAAWAVIQVLFFSTEFGRRAHDPLVNPNNLAALLGLALLPALAMALTGRRVAMAFSALLFAGILATQSRGGLLCCAAAVVPLCFILRRTIAANRGRTLKLLAGGIVIFASMQFLTTAPVGSRLLLFAHPSGDTSLVARLSIWRSTLKLIAAHPWGGTGLGTFFLYYPAVRAPLIDDSSGSWAHNDPLQFWAETGIAAPLLLYAFAVAAVIRTAHALRRTPHNESRAPLAGISCGLLALFLHAHGEFDLYIMPTLIAAGAALAGWYHLTADALQDGFRPAPLLRWQRPFMAGAILLAAFTIAFAAGSSAAGQLYLRRAQASIDHGDLTNFLDNIQKAERRAPGSFIDPEVQLAGFYIDMLSHPSLVIPPDESAKMFRDARDLLDEAGRLDPAWSEIDRKRAKLYGEVPVTLMPNDKAQAFIALQSAVRKNPMDFRARQELAQALIARGQPEEAYHMLESGLGYPHDAGVTKDYAALMQSIRPFAILQHAARAKERTGTP